MESVMTFPAVPISTQPQSSCHSNIDFLELNNTFAKSIAVYFDAVIQFFSLYSDIFSC